MPILSERGKEYLLKTVLGGWRQTEVADEEQITKQTVSNIINRSKEKLRMFIE